MPPKIFHSIQDLSDTKEIDFICCPEKHIEGIYQCVDELCKKKAEHKIVISRATIEGSSFYKSCFTIVQRMDNKKHKIFKDTTKNISFHSKYISHICI